MLPKMERSLSLKTSILYLRHLWLLGCDLQPRTVLKLQSLHSDCLGLSPALELYSCVTWGKLLNPSVLQYPHS